MKHDAILSILQCDTNFGRRWHFPPSLTASALSCMEQLRMSPWPYDTLASMSLSASSPGAPAASVPSIITQHPIIGRMADWPPPITTPPDREVWVWSWPGSRLFPLPLYSLHLEPDSKVHGANMGPIWGRQDSGGPHVGPMKLAIWGAAWLNWQPTTLSIYLTHLQ